MTNFLKSRLETYFIENRVDALKIAEQVLINKRSRESAEKQRLNIKKKLSGSIDISNRVEKFVDAARATSRAARSTSSRRQRPRQRQALARRRVSGHHARAR